MRRVKWSKAASKGKAAKADPESNLQASLQRAEERFRERQQQAMEEFLLEQRCAIEAHTSELKARRVPELAKECDDQALKASAEEESASGPESNTINNVLASAEEGIQEVGKTLTVGMQSVEAPLLQTLASNPIVGTQSLKAIRGTKYNITAHNRIQELLLPVVTSNPWKLASAMLVLSMCFELGISVHCKLREEIGESSSIAGFTDGWAKANTLFFVCEFVVELFAQQGDFFCGVHKKWNLFDSILLIINIAFTVNLVSEKDFGVLRVFRSLRMLRLLEIFPELRTMLYSICACASSVGWSACLLFAYCWMIAIYLMEASVTVFTDLEWHKKNSGLDDSMIEVLKSDWGSIHSSLLSLTKAVTGGADWGDLAAPFFRMHPWGKLHCAVFVSFVMGSTFVLFNIVVGLIVSKSEEVGSWDRDTALHNAHSKIKDDQRDLSALFDEFDTQGTGVVSVSAIERGLETPRIRAFFRHLQIDIVRAHLMLKFFDKDDTGDVDKDEFINGCLRLRGSAKPAEVAELLAEVQSIKNKLDELCQCDGPEASASQSAA